METDNVTGAEFASANKVEEEPLKSDDGSGTASNSNSSEGNQKFALSAEQSEEKDELMQTVINAIRSVYDPELPVNVYDLGLIYNVDISEENDLNIDMTLTTPGCPVAGDMVAMVASTVEALPGVRTVDVRLVWDPPWDMSRISDSAKLDLGLL